MTLWSAGAAAAITGGEARGDWHATGVSIDSRTLRPGDLFVALRDQRDGHDFVARALENGAAAAMVARIPADVPEDVPLLLVEDVQTALEALGRAARARSAARVVAVTGSVGKTSAKEMLRTVLSAQGRTHAAEASYNNHWGVPLTLARMPAETDYAVIEIGMNHPGEIAPLARLARPHVALVTTVAAAHLEAFAGLEDIAREKAAVFAGLEPGGTAVINADIATAPILAEAARAAGAAIVDFGETGAAFRFDEAVLAEGATMARATIHGAPALFKIMTEGRHFAMNGLGVLAAAEALGADCGLAAIALANWSPPPGRGRREVIRLDPANEALTLELIDDAFNANPASMTAALAVLAAAAPRDGLGRVVKGRRIAVLGDMLELGAEEAALHAALAESPEMDSLSQVHCVGPRMKALWRALPEGRRGKWVETAEELAEEVHRMVDAGDVVLIKGSKGSRVSLVAEALRRSAR